MVHSLSRSHFSQCSGKGSPSTVTEILGVTRQALYNRIRGCTNPVMFSDLHFDSAIRSITERYSNDVEVMVGGHLTRGKRVHCVYPEGVCKKGVLSPKEQSGHTRRVFVSWQECQQANQIVGTGVCG